ncbi:hypothetical protein EDB84DRAFT_1679883 [Lactarius hengduanensis]|nr:hypothetical protein EDB84DRAFT_1679883 [Lactarius hengduanensis]
MSSGVEAFEDERYELAVSGCRQHETGRMDNGSSSLTRQPGLGYEAVQWVHPRASHGPLASSASASTTSGSVACTSAPFIQKLGEARFSSVSQPRISSSTSWRSPSQVVYIKHEYNVGLVSNLAQLVDVVPPRLLFHLAAPDRDTANRMSSMAVVDVSHASDESVGLDAIIASLRRGSRGKGWADRIGGGKVGEIDWGWMVGVRIICAADFVMRQYLRETPVTASRAKDVVEHLCHRENKIRRENAGKATSETAANLIRYSWGREEGSTRVTRVSIGLYPYPYPSKPVPVVAGTGYPCVRVRVHTGVAASYGFGGFARVARLWYASVGVVVAVRTVAVGGTSSPSPSPREIGSGGDSRQRLGLRVDDYERIDDCGRVIVRVILEHRGEEMPVNRVNVKVGVSKWDFRYASQREMARHHAASEQRGECSPRVTAFGSDPSFKEYTLPSGECEKYHLHRIRDATPGIEGRPGAKKRGRGRGGNAGVGVNMTDGPGDDAATETVGRDSVSAQGDVRLVLQLVRASELYVKGVAKSSCRSLSLLSISIGN